MRRRTLRPHVRSYADPIAFQAGDRVYLTERRDSWHGQVWGWAVGPDGREGWIPLDVLDTVAGEGAARCDFNAIELSVESDQWLDVLEQRLGWGWCVDGHGEAGWVPLEVFAQEGEPSSPQD